MADTPDIIPAKKRTRRKQPSAKPVASVDLATEYLAGQLFRDVPGQQSADRLNQSQHDDGVTYIAINALMTAIRSSTVQINRKRKSIARDTEGGTRVTKSLPSPGSKNAKEDYVKFDNENHPLVKLLARPNPSETINEILAQLVQQIMLTGSGLMWLNMDQLDFPSQLYIMPTALCQAQPPSPQYPFGYWRVTQYYPAGAYGMLPSPNYGGGVPIDARNMPRFKMPHPLWRWDALSPLTAGGVQITVLEAIDRARMSAMQNGLTPDAFFLMPGLGQDQVNAFLEQLRVGSMGKSNHRKAVAIGGEMNEKHDWKVMFPNTSAKEMDFQAGWDQMTGFALALYGVPKAIANFSGTSSYAELYAAQQQFYTFTLQPLAEWLSSWLTRHLCHDAGWLDYSIQIDVPAINDKDMQERQRSTNLQNGLLMYNEARAQQDLPPVPGGDDVIASVFVQMQTAKAQAAAAPPPQSGDAPAPDGQPAPDAGQEQSAPPESADPLAALLGGTDESTPNGEQIPDDDDEQSTQDAVGNAALAALGISDDAQPRERVEKALTATPTKPGTAKKPANPGNATAKPPAHQEGQKFESNGKWFIIKNKRAVPTSAPGTVESIPEDESDRVAWDKAAPTQKPSTTKSPPVKPGHVRLYHGGDKPTSGGVSGARWVHSDHPYAEGYARKTGTGKVYYVDVPKDHPLVQANTVPHGGTSFNAPYELAKNFKHHNDVPVGNESINSETAEDRVNPSSPSRPAPDILASITKHPGAKKFGLTPEVLAKMHPDAVAQIATQLGLTPPTPSPVPPEEIKAAVAANKPVPDAAIEHAAASVPSFTPVAQRTLSRVDQWASSQADKHAERVAAHFGISPARAHGLLMNAMKQVAQHAAQSGKTLSVTINQRGGKAVKLNPTKQLAKPQPTPNKTGAPSIPRPSNPAGKGSLPPRVGKFHRGGVRPAFLELINHLKAVTHAPKGGVSVGGTKFTGGEFIPSAVMSNATSEERREVESGHAQPSSPSRSSVFPVNPKTGLVDRARVGVPAMSVPPPPATIPQLPNLSDKQRKVEKRFAEAYLADPDGMADKYLKALRKRKVGVEPNVFATDDVKALNPDWNPGKVRPGEKLDEETSKAMAKYNTAVHQTANAVAKRAFLKYLDTTVKNLPPDKRTVLVTNGGCAAGKGSSLARATDPNSPYANTLPAAAQVGAVWDAAGEQNATENEWILEECKKRGITPTFAYVWADPKDTWDAPDRGVIRRAMRKGRMVDARLYADSYAEGAKNMHAFYEKHKGDGTQFVFLDNRKKGEPKMLNTFPTETLKWDANAIYRDAVQSLEKHRDKLPKALVKGGLAGTKIWGPPT